MGPQPVVCAICDAARLGGRTTCRAVSEVGEKGAWLVMDPATLPYLQLALAPFPSPSFL